MIRQCPISEQDLIYHLTHASVDDNGWTDDDAWIADHCMGCDHCATKLGMLVDGMVDKLIKTGPTQGALR